ncbi:hypothetical protein [Enemella sp. A6]|uniref:hypothetical protein n=1 Tax=Enemella sp. A6 TaxID=3440152 RepID=UPI003EBB540D
MSSSEISEMLRAFLNDPDRLKYHQSGDPHDWQRRFEDRIENIGRQGAALNERIQQVEAEAGDRVIGVRVGAGGQLLGLRFRPDAGKATREQLTAAFAEQYQAACAEADEQIQQILADSDLPVSDFNPFGEPDQDEETT